MQGNMSIVQTGLSIGEGRVYAHKALLETAVFHCFYFFIFKTQHKSQIKSCQVAHNRHAKDKPNTQESKGFGTLKPKKILIERTGKENKQTNKSLKGELGKSQLEVILGPLCTILPCRIKSVRTGK